MNIRDKVLLVEDERTIRSFMQAILTANGYDVLMAGTGAMANTMIASHCPDIIILDLGLPDMDGMTILRNVRKWSKVPILVVSARSHERDKVEALDAGADDYLTKPFGTEELLARIRAAGNPVAETVAGWLDFFFAFHRTKGYAGAPVHDAVAVCALLRPDLLHFEDWHVTVETQGAFCRGATVGDRRTAPNARVITGIDREGFAELLTEAVRTYG